MPPENIINMVECNWDLDSISALIEDSVKEGIVGWADHRMEQLKVPRTFSGEEVNLYNILQDCFSCIEELQSIDLTDWIKIVKNENGVQIVVDAKFAGGSLYFGNIMVSFDSDFGCVGDIPKLEIVLEGKEDPIVKVDKILEWKNSE